MKVISFKDKSGNSWGVLEGTKVIDLGRAWQTKTTPTLSQALADRSFTELLSKRDEAQVLELAEVKLDFPIPDPQKILCVGLNYAGHILETGREKPEYPVIFTRFLDSLVPNGAELVLPELSEKFDFEGELAVVIGKPMHRVSPEEALAGVLGYSIFNDGTIRDFQRHTPQFTPGKNFLATGSFGPLIVTPDELEPLGSQTITTTLNGEVMQQAELAQLIFSVAELISYCSKWTKLNPGDVIATGTPDGVGYARNPRLWLKPGDQIEISISGIGTLSNRVIAESVSS